MPTDPIQDQPKNEAITGEFTFIAAPNHSGWSFGTFKPDQGGKFSVSGNALVNLKPHTPYTIYGNWTTFRDAPQLKINYATPNVAANRISVSRYLSKAFKNIGPKKAEDLIDLWLKNGKTIEELRNVIVEEPHQLESWAKTQNFGVAIELVMRQDGHPDVNHVLRFLMIHHKIGEDQSVMIPDGVLRKVARHLLGIKPETTIKDENPNKAVSQAIEAFRENPFLAIFEVEGYGFKMADKVWQAEGGSKTHPNRLAALGWYLIDDQCTARGHTHIPLIEFEKAINQTDLELDASVVIQAMIKKETPFVFEEESRLYTQSLYRSETKAKEWIESAMLKNASPILKRPAESLKERMEQLEQKINITLDPNQKKALLGLAQSNQRIHTLTAMPGCGKTAIMEFLAEMALDENTSISFMAPTGRASKVLGSRIKRLGLTANTIHSAIGYGGPPKHITSKVIVADEAGMIDLALFRDLIKSIRPDAHLILVGDKDQLASVGPGNVLGDLLSLDLDHHELTQVHRSTGDILTLVECIKEGVYQKQNPQNLPEKDVLTFALPDPDQIDQVLEKYIEEAHKAKGGFERVTLLTGKRKGQKETPGWNTTYLNCALQEKINPSGEHVRGTSLKVKDRIIFKKNTRIPNELNPKDPLFLANGETGVLLSQAKNETGQIQSIDVKLDNGQRFELPPEVLSSMDLAYAITIHAAQGSEYDCVFVAMQDGLPDMFNRKLLYTGVSRAKEKLYLLGNGQTLSRIASRSGNSRHSFLPQRIKNNTPSLIVEEDLAQQETHHARPKIV